MIPEQCKDCLCYLFGDRCIVMAELQRAPCYARTLDQEEFDRRNKSIANYERQFRKEHEDDPVEDDRTPAERLRGISLTEIHVAMSEDMSRGSHKGGSSEKEKAPNKKRKGTKIYIEPWDSRH